jgi:hypothetical protein
MKSYVDSTGQVARITTFMRDIGTGNMAVIENTLWTKINKIFPLIATSDNDWKSISFEKERNTYLTIY